MSNNPTTPVDEPVTDLLKSLGFEYSDVANSYYHPDHDGPVAYVTLTAATLFYQLMQAREREARLNELRQLLNYWKKVKLDTKYDIGKTAGHVHERIQKLQPKPQAGEGGE